jgi:hypothetical protein
MGLELTAALIVLLAVAVVRLVRRRAPNQRKPLPDVGSAPPSAEPIAVQWWTDDGLWRYYRELPTTTDPEERHTTE